VLLSSVDAGLRTDKQLQSSPVCVSYQHSPVAESGLQNIPQAPTSELGTKSVDERRVAPWYAAPHRFKTSQDTVRSWLWYLL
jgi:hypothetical protein